MKRLLFACLLCLAWVSWGEATCSGSGLSYACTAGSTVAQVNSAIASASDGATITFATGSYSWSSMIDLNQAGSQNGVTLICETKGACTVSVSGTVFGMNYIPSNVTNLVRISGFAFSGSISNFIWIYGSKDVQKFRVDNNTFANTSPSGCPQGIFLGAADGTPTGRVFGVVDSNTFTGSINWRAILPAWGNSDSWQAGYQGTANNLVIEDNVFNFTSQSASGCGAIDANNGTSLVVRFNTVTNSSIIVHGACHDGPFNTEVYHNTVVTADWAPIFLQGAGEYILFNNAISGGATRSMLVNDYRGDSGQLPNGWCTSSDVCDGTDARDGNRSPTTTHRGYPCYLQPARDVSGTLKPVYVWRNTLSGSKTDLLLWSDGYAPNHFKANRDYYNATSANAQTSPTSPFNGTTGMGYGTKANRPTTCTPTEDALDAGKGGVGYWATDEGYWNSKTPGTPSGVLYRCSATNTWTLHYVPYPYPHPLRSGLAAPTGLTVQ